MPDNLSPQLSDRRPLVGSDSMPRAFSLAAFAMTVLCIFAAALSVCVYYLYAPEVDFVSFWAAGRLALGGHPAAAYDVHTHRAVEETVSHIGGLMPFPYPPPFLLAVASIAWLPYWAAYAPWILATSGLYLLATKHLMPARFALALPASIVNVMIGQNGFLTAAIFLFGTAAIETQPFAGGLILGLLVIKPQLGVLLPIALLAGRQWRSIVGAALSSSALLAVAAFVFGIDSYRGFFAMTQQYAAFMAADRWDWAQQASIFGFFRFLGAPQPVALATQAIVAIAAGVVTWRAWAQRSPQRTAVLAAATLLVPPYVFTYDSLLLVLPFSLLLKDRQRPWRVAVLWACLLAPLFGYFGLYPGPNTVPVAAVLSLWWLSKKSETGARDPHPRLQMAPEFPL